MRWTPGGSSDDVEDRRDDSGSGGTQFGGFHLGIGGLIIVFVLSLVFHRNFLPCLAAVPAERLLPLVSNIGPKNPRQLTRFCFCESRGKEFFNTHAWFRQLC